MCTGGLIIQLSKLSGNYNFLSAVMSCIIIIQLSKLSGNYNMLWTKIYTKYIIQLSKLSGNYNSGPQIMAKLSIIQIVREL